MRARHETWGLAVGALFAACDADTAADAAAPDATAPDATAPDATSDATLDATAGGAGGSGGEPAPSGGTSPGAGGTFGDLGGSATDVERPVGACAGECACSTWFIAPPYPPDPGPLFETACAGEGGTPVSTCPDADARGVCEQAVEFFTVRRAYVRDDAQCPTSAVDLQAACEAGGGAWE
jgi:hypothetical protein